MPQRTIDHVFKVLDVLKAHGFGEGNKFAPVVLRNLIELHITRDKNKIDEYIEYMHKFKLLEKLDDKLWTIDWIEVEKIAY